MRRCWIAMLFVAVALVMGMACGGLHAEPRATLADFRRDRLLGRFDRNNDGRLDEQEKGPLREAWGGIDVPMLPTDSFEYVKSMIPRPLTSSELAELDNSPTDNPLTNPGATLGRILFYDRQLSRNDKIACASCHEQQHGFADPRRYSVGFAGGRTGRNAMSLVNLRYSNLSGSRPGFFWDERAPTLETQALMPIQDKIEMGMRLDELEGKLQKLPYYPPLFGAAFGSDRVTSDRIGKAMAQFMRALESWDSKFDRAALSAKVGDRLSAQESQGKSLFIDGLGVAEHGCAHCHLPPTFGMPRSFNNGLDLKYADRGLGALGKPSNDPFTVSDEGKFKAPSLRNVELTAPYMHDGRFESLEEVIDHYSVGVQPHENLGLAFPEGEPGKPSGFKFTAQQKAALVAFLKTLTDERFTTDPRFSDPFVRLRNN